MTTKPRNISLRIACGILLGSGLISSYADYATQVLSNKPVGYWRLNDKAQVALPDVAKNLGNLGASANGYFSGASLHPVGGALASGTDTAASFDGTAGTIVNVPYRPELSPVSAFSIEAWLNPSVANPSGTLTCALSCGKLSDPRSGWIIYQSDTGWNFRMYNKNGTATSANITGGPAPTVGAWYHVVAVYNGTNAFVYVNGVQAATAVPTGYVPNENGAFFIGGRSDSSYWWNGMADEVAFYNKALSAADISAHYQNGASASPSTPYNQVILNSGPMLYFRLNENTYTAPTTLPAAKNLGSAAAASNGSYYPGTDNTVAGPQPPIYSGFEADNTAGGFNGSAGYVGTPMNMNDLIEFSVMGWVKRGVIHSGRGGYFGQNDLLEFGDADAGANIEAWINAYGTNIKMPYPFRDNEWGFITIVGNSSKVVLYTNGVAAATSEKAVDSFGSSAYNFNIGGGGVFNVSGDYFNGNIDEVALFDKALTAAQVQDIYFGANIAPTIVKQPVAPDRVLSEGNAATLTVTAVGSPTIQYQWRKDGADLAGKTLSELALSNVKVSDSGAYDVVVRSNYGSVTSAVVNLTIKTADTVAPTIQYFTSSKTFNGIRIWFSEPLDSASAQTASNYQISDGLTVISAKLSAPAGSVGDNIVDLVTSAQTPGKSYTVTVNGVKDQSFPGNAVAANSTVSVGSWTLAQGYLTFEHYDNISGAADSDITKGLADPRVIAGTPTTAGFIVGRFDTRTVFPDDSHENYMARTTGFITPTVTDDYTFFIRSDDASRLYLSADETMPDPAKATPIAAEAACCRAFQEPGDAATSAPIRLQAGKRYAVLVLLKEGGGGDWMMVAWRRSNDTTVAANLPFLSGEYLSTYVDPNVDIQFTKQPSNQPGVLPSTVVELVSKDFKANDGGFTVENTEPAPPGPFAYDSASGVWSADGGESACSGPYNSRLNSPAFTVPQNDEVTLDFTHRYSFEGDRWDGGQVRISVNGGAFTTVPAANFTANGYAQGTIQGTGIINGQAGFNADSPGYSTGAFITSSAILGSFKKGDTIVVQFVGAWDDCTTGSVPGWVIKNVKLSYGTAPKASTFEGTAVATKQGKAASFNYQWQRNNGTDFVDITGANTSTLRIFPTAADFNATFRLAASVPGKAAYSNVVKLTQGTEAPPEISIKSAAGVITITFTGTLQSSPTASGQYQNVAGAQSPYTAPSTQGSMFFRCVK